MNHLIFLISFVLSASCYLSQSASFEIINGDTCNRINPKGKKYGKWICLGRHKSGTCYSATQKIEEGNYLGNKKNGIWLEYFCNGYLKSKIVFVNGRPNGHAVIYHENGVISEEGRWRNNYWVGVYKMYNDSGKLIHKFKFDSPVKREGRPTIHPDNGKIAIEGNFINSGKEPQVKEYKEQDFLEYKILYDHKKRLIKKGEFNNDSIWNGKKYLYNEAGKLNRIAVYKNGLYVGDTQIEK
jgi:antitoxin component YwqK of YwqJK toxin-antitoxin module